MKLLFLLFFTFTLGFTQENWMISFYGVNPPNNSGLESFDFSPITNSKNYETQEISNYAFNIHRKVGNDFLIGLIFKQFSHEINQKVEKEYLTAGLSFLYQSDLSFLKSYYIGLECLLTSNRKNQIIANSSSSKKSSYRMKFGKRFKVGHIWGMGLSYAPEFIYTMSTEKFKSSSSLTTRKNSFQIELIKFDLFF